LKIKSAAAKLIRSFTKTNMAATQAASDKSTAAEWPALENSHLQADVERLAAFLSQEQNTLLISPGICIGIICMGNLPHGLIVLTAFYLFICNNQTRRFFTRTGFPTKSK
jgi:hypothetical protein